MTQKPHTRTRILVVDDHPIVRQGYVQMINGQPDLEVCGWASSEFEAMEQARSTTPDLAIVDITLKDSNGIDLVTQFRARYQQVKILVISAHDDNLYAERALEAGALGYVNKLEATEKLIDAIRKVLAGEVYVSEQITRRLLKRRVAGGNKEREDGTAIDTLTDRELHVYEMIGHGRTTQQIANRLHLSPKTIERYKENIKRKLDIRNATELIQQATRWVLEKG